MTTSLGRKQKHTTASDSNSVNFTEYLHLEDDYKYIFEVFENNDRIDEEINNICTDVSIYF